MFAQSKPHPEMIELVAQLKVRHGPKIVAVSNEARELNSHRIRKFKLDGFVDAFISSCFVHIRKPDADTFRLALDITQTPYFVEGHEPGLMHEAMATTLDTAVEQIREIQQDARVHGNCARPRWPMIALNSPKGWTGPKMVDGLQVEGTFRRMQTACCR
jgi:hypothetical protein